MSGERKRGFLRLDSDEMVEKPERWGMPDYTAQTHKKARDTAMNYDPSWMPISEPVKEEAPTELTEEEIQLIKQQAYQEGLHQAMVSADDLFFVISDQLRIFIICVACLIK